MQSIQHALVLIVLQLRYELLFVLLLIALGHSRVGVASLLLVLGLLLIYEHLQIAALLG